MYLGFSDLIRREGRPYSMTDVVRVRIRDHRWVDQQVIFQADPETYFPSRQHHGIRIAFCNEGFIYFPIGDRGRGRFVQDLAYPNGKLHRLHDDGRVPSDNPFVDRSAYPEALASV